MIVTLYNSTSYYIKLYDTNNTNYYLYCVTLTGIVSVVLLYHTRYLTRAMNSSPSITCVTPDVRIFNTEYRIYIKEKSMLKQTWLPGNTSQ